MFNKLRKNFNFYVALRVYISYLISSLFNGSSYKLKFPWLATPIFLRKKTTDLHVFEQIFLELEYDFWQLKNINTIIDAGANIGLASLYLKTKFPKATFHLIEPDPENMKMIKKNTANDAAFFLHQKGLWNSNAHLKILDKTEEKWAIQITECGENESDVEAISINELVKEFELEILDLVKMDIEGAERYVFEKNIEWLKNTRYLIIELHDFMVPGSSRTFFKTIAEHNFAMDLRGENLLFINQDLLS